MARNRYYDGPVSDHFDGTRFYNMGRSPGRAETDRFTSELLRWRLLGRRNPWPGAAPIVPVRPVARSEQLVVTLVGHASVLLQVAGCNVLIDPVWARRASPLQWFGPERWDAPGVAFDDLPPIDTVLVSHDHYDHLDTRTLRRLWRAHRPRIIAPLGNDAIIGPALRGGTLETGDWGDAFALSPRVRVTLHPAHHWSARGVRDRRHALWCGFVLHTPAGVIYVSGDTAYGDGAPFRLVRERFGPPRLAVLPVGAYEPRWFMKPQHVNPEESVRILLDCGAAQGLGVHWGTFRLTDEARFDPPVELRAACVRHGVDPARFTAMRPGETWSA